MKPQGAELVRPGQIFKHSGDRSALTVPALEEAARQFEARSANFAEFYRTVEDSRILDAILHLTDRESFLAMTLDAAQKNAGSRNSWADFLHGEHTSYSSVSGSLGWYGFYASWFTATPIPKNKAAIAKGQRSLELLAAMAEVDRGFYDDILNGVHVALIQDTALLANDISISVAGVAEVGHEVLRPQMVDAASRSILVDDQVFHNGLPGDRSRFPTYLLPEGSRLRVSVKNTSASTVYLVVPTINGIPFHVERATLDYDGFVDSSLPLAQLAAAKQYLRPGQELVLDHFQVDRTTIARDARSSSYSSNINDHSSQGALEELAFVAEPLIKEKFSADALARLEGLPDALKRQLLFESNVGYLKAWLGYLQEARKTKIYMRRPVLAGSSSSSDLDNPFLGSLGFTLMRVERPPVKAEHISSFSFGAGFRGGESYGGAMKGGGIAGLGSIGGDSDLAAVRKDPFDFQYDSSIHRFVGYFPVNLMSTSEALRVVK